MTDLPDGGLVWRARIAATDGGATGELASKVAPPAGAWIETYHSRIGSISSKGSWVLIDEVDRNVPGPGSVFQKVL